MADQDNLAAPKTEAEIELEKIYDLADWMAIQYHTLHQRCALMLSAAHVAPPPYAMQIAAYREARHEQIKVKEKRVQPAIKEHKKSAVLQAKTPLVNINGRKLN